MWCSWLDILVNFYRVLSFDPDFSLLSPHLFVGLQRKLEGFFVLFWPSLDYISFEQHGLMLQAVSSFVHEPGETPFFTYLSAANYEILELN